MSVIPSGYAELSWHFTFDGTTHESITTMGVNTSDVVTILDANDVMTTFADQFSDVIGSAVDLVRAIVRVGTDDDPLVIESTQDLIHMAGGDTLPPQCSFLVRKLTAFGGKKNRGRMYIPGANDNLVDTAGKLSDAGLTALQGAASGLKTDLLDLSWISDLVVLHSAGVALPTVITSLIAENEIATQRRRLR